LRSFAAYLGQRILKGPSPLASIRIPRAAETSRLAVKDGELGRLLRFSQQGPQGLRNHALVRLAAGAGLRIGEIAALRMGDVLWRDGEIEVRGITSKSRRSRRVTMHREVAAALDRYIGEYREGPEDDAAPVFLTRTAQGFAVGGLASVFRSLSRESGVRVSAHLLRHGPRTIDAPDLATCSTSRPKAVGGTCAWS
jgi:integrase